MNCPFCAATINDGAEQCSRCANWLYSVWRVADTEPDVANDSGTGPLARLPDELRGWCWGAFLLSIAWAVIHQVWLGLLVFLIFVPGYARLGGVIMLLVLGVNGNAWAWQNRKFKNVAHFKKVQRAWTIAAVLFIVAAIMTVGTMLVWLNANGNFLGAFG